MRRFCLLLLLLPFLACSRAAFLSAPTATPTKTPRPLALEKVSTATDPDTGAATSVSQVTPASSPAVSPVAEVTLEVTANIPTATPLPSTPTPAATATPAPLPPTETPTLTPVPPTAEAALSSTNPKKGLGVIASPACDDLVTLQAAWYLNWWPNPDPTCEGQDGSFVPRIANPDAMQYLALAIENAQPSGWLIGFSEPNLHTQGNMSPAHGAELWKQIEEAAAAASIKLVSPSPNQFKPSQDDPYGNQWLWAMVDEYRARYGQNPHFDAIGWNIYGCTNNPNCYNIDGIKQYLSDRRQEALNRGYDVPIWVLEYGGCQTEDSAASDQAVMSAITAWFNETPWIERYAWFSNRVATSFQGTHNCVLIDGNGSLTVLGQIYQGY